MKEETRSNNGGRIPPQDVVAEKSLIGAILISNDALPEILNIIKPRDFYEKRHQIIFSRLSIYTINTSQSIY